MKFFCKIYRRVAYSFISILILGIVPFVVHAQKAHCTLNGSIRVSGGPAYPYSIIINGSSKKIKGLSVTDQDGLIVKTRIKGAFDKEKKVLILAETSVVGKLPDSLEMCFVGAVIKWTNTRGILRFSGAFVGTDKKKNVCSKGEITFQVAAKTCPMFIDNSVKPDPPPPPMSESNTKELEHILAGKENKITVGDDKVIDWVSNTCQLEIWDAGVEDGDVVDVTVNARKVLSGYKLTRERKKVLLQLSENKADTVTITAINEGSAPLNTAQLILTDGETLYNVTASNEGGKSASIIIKRK